MDSSEGPLPGNRDVHLGWSEVLTLHVIQEIRPHSFKKVPPVIRMHGRRDQKATLNIQLLNAHATMLRPNGSSAPKRGIYFGMWEERSVAGWSWAGKEGSELP